MNGCTTPLIWGWPADFVDVSHLWPHSVMAGVPTDAVAPDPADLELREDLEFEIVELRRNLKILHFDVDAFPDVLKETRAMHWSLDVQILRLRRHAARLRECLTRAAPSSPTPSALLSASAPPLKGPAPSSNYPSTRLSYWHHKNSCTLRFWTTCLQYCSILHLESICVDDPVQRIRSIE